MYYTLFRISVFHGDCTRAHACILRVEIYSMYQKLLLIASLFGSVCGVRRAYTLPDCEGSSLAASSSACGLARFVALTDQAGGADLRTVSASLYHAQQANSQSKAYLVATPLAKLNVNLGAVFPMALNDLVGSLNPSISSYYTLTNQSLTNTKLAVTGMDQKFNESLATLQRNVQTALVGERALDVAGLNMLISVANQLNQVSGSTTVYADLAKYLATIPPQLLTQIASMRNANTPIQSSLLTLPGSLAAISQTFANNLTRIANLASASLANSVEAINTTAQTNINLMNSTVTKQQPSVETSITNAIANWKIGEFNRVDVKNRTYQTRFLAVNKTLIALNTSVYTNASLATASIESSRRYVGNSTNSLNAYLRYNLTNNTSWIRNTSIIPVDAWGPAADARLGNLSASLDAARASISLKLANGTSSSSLSGTLYSAMAGIGNLQSNLVETLANQSRNSVDAMNNLTRKIDHDDALSEQIFVALNTLRNIVGANTTNNITSAATNISSLIAQTATQVQVNATLATQATNDAVALLNKKFFNATTNVTATLDAYQQLVANKGTWANERTLFVQTLVDSATDAEVAQLTALLSQISDYGAHMRNQADVAIAQASTTGSSINDRSAVSAEMVQSLFDQITRKNSDISALFWSIGNSSSQQLSSNIAAVQVPNLAEDAADVVNTFGDKRSAALQEFIRDTAALLASIDERTAAVRQRVADLMMDSLADPNSVNLLADFDTKSNGVVNEFNSAATNSAAESQALDSLSSETTAGLAAWNPSSVVQTVGALQTRLAAVQQRLGTSTATMGSLSSTLGDQMTAFTKMQAGDLQSVSSLLNSAANIQAIVVAEMDTLDNALRAQNASFADHIGQSISQLKKFVYSSYLPEMAKWVNEISIAKSTLTAAQTLPSVVDPREASLDTNTTNFKTLTTSKLSNLTSAINSFVSDETLVSIQSDVDGIANLLTTGKIPDWNRPITTVTGKLAAVSSLTDAAVANATAAAKHLAGDTWDAAMAASDTSARDFAKLAALTNASLVRADASVAAGIDVANSLDSVMAANLATRSNSLSAAANNVATANTKVAGLIGSALAGASSAVPGDVPVVLPDLTTLGAFATYTDNTLTQARVAMDSIDRGITASSTGIKQKLAQISQTISQSNQSIKTTIHGITDKEFDLEEVLDRIQSVTSAMQTAVTNNLTPPDSLSPDPINKMILSSSAIAAAASTASDQLAALEARVDDMLKRAA